MTKQEYEMVLTEIDWLESEIERLKSELEYQRIRQSEFEMNSPEDDWA